MQSRWEALAACAFYGTGILILLGTTAVMITRIFG